MSTMPLLPYLQRRLAPNAISPAPLQRILQTNTLPLNKPFLQLRLPLPPHLQPSRILTSRLWAPSNATCKETLSRTTVAKDI